MRRGYNNKIGFKWGCMKENNIFSSIFMLENLEVSKNYLTHTHTHTHTQEQTYLTFARARIIYYIIVIYNTCPSKKVFLFGGFLCLISCLLFYHAPVV